LKAIDPPLPYGRGSVTTCKHPDAFPNLWGSQSWLQPPFRRLLRCATLLLLAIALTGCAPKPEPVWFKDIAIESGIDFTHNTGATGQFYMPEIMGSGGGFLDHDADGDLDVILMQGAPLPAAVGGTGSRLYRNDLIPSGKLQFKEVTHESGFDYSGYGMGVTTGDFDRDGRVDVLATGFGGNALFRNEGGSFRNVTHEHRDVALPGRWSSGAAFFDFDSDGQQDLVILNYLDYSVDGNKRCTAPSGEVTYCTPKAYGPTSIRLFHNDRGRLVDVTERAGINRALGRGLGVAIVDANGDRRPDIFVANDASANHLWINNGGNGAFDERGLQSGVAYGDEGLAKAGMGVAAGDYDNDGDEDLLVLNLMREGATLFEKTAQGSYSDASMRTRMHAITFPYTGFGGGWADFDGDGYLDLFAANGAVTLREEQRGQPYPFRERKLLIRNSQNAFIDVSAQGGEAFSQPEVSRGAAFGDIDNDGDVDVLVTANNGRARLLRNELPRRSWLAVRVDGPGIGLGTRVSVKAKDLPEMWRTIRTDGSYLSASDSKAYFGLGDSKEVERVTIHWPDGTRTDMRGKLNSVMSVSRP
jgi:hypothetical protein